MYVPSRHQPPSNDSILALIRAHPLAMVVRNVEGELVADHIPMVLANNDRVLQGHVAIGNALAREKPHNQVLVIFNGPSSYISPSWFRSKEEDPAIVPTWNYVVAHVKGRLVQHSDPNWLLDHLESLSNHSERLVQESWALSDAPSNYLRTLVSGIVGIEIEISELIGKWKTTIVKPEENLLSVTSALKKRDASAMADWMQKRCTKKC